MSPERIIPIFRPSYGEKEKQAVWETMDSGWVGLGPKTEKFEKAFAEKVGAKYAIGLNSCTAALDLALKANDITGGEVIVPALTFVSTGLAPLYNNNKVVFADIDEKTLCIDWEDVKRKITPNTKAVIPVWYSGRVVQPPELGVTVIEDCAHATGNPEAGKHTACWSFHAVKNLATADGGMITTNDEEVYKKLLPMRWCGIDKSTWERAQKKYGWDYSIDSIGTKTHMNDLTASIGLVQLERLEEMNNTRIMWVMLYNHNLKNVDWLKLPEFDENSSNHMYVVRIKAEVRERFIDYMLAHGISVGVHYKPLNTYEIFPQTELPVTDRVWKTLVTLPLFPDLTNEDFYHVIKTILAFKC